MENSTEAKHDLEVLKQDFMSRTGGVYPVCLDWAIKAVEETEAFEKAKTEIYQLSLCWEYGQGVQDCINILDKYGLG